MSGGRGATIGLSLQIGASLSFPFGFPSKAPQRRDPTKTHTREHVEVHNSPWRATQHFHVRSATPTLLLFYSAAFAESQGTGLIAPHLPQQLPNYPGERWLQGKLCRSRSLGAFLEPWWRSSLHRMSLVHRVSLVQVAWTNAKNTF